MPDRKNLFTRFRMDLIGIILIIIPIKLAAQAQDTVRLKFTLSECVSYALKNQPFVKQAVLDERITSKDINLGFSGWFPQLGFDAGFQKYFQLPPLTYTNNFSGIFSATQALYSNRLLYNVRSAKELRNRASENTIDTRINTYVNVTKAFFDVLLTGQQVSVLKEAITRLERNYKDALNLYRNGLTDRTDYQRTEISLSNARAQKKSAEESLKGKYSVLKALIGVDPSKDLSVVYDSTGYEKEILADTTQNLDYSNRIEFKQLQSELRLQTIDMSYYRWSFLPSLSAFYNYNAIFYNDRYQDLFRKMYPNSLAGISLSLPLFQGTSRLQNLGKSKLKYERLQYEIDGLKSSISSEYTVALSNYKSSLNQLRVARDNITLAREIFSTIRLQYEKGIKAYLEVIISETDLRTAELNYLNILFQVLSSKLDLEKAEGIIKV